MAQTRSRQLPAHEASAEAAREMAVAAGRLPDPVLKLALTNLPIDGPDRFSVTRDFMTMRSVGVAQEFTRSGKRGARSARYLSEADLAQARRVEALADLQRETALAWLEVFHRERLLELMRDQRAEAQLQIDAADAVYRGGRGSQVEAIGSRAALAAIDDRLLVLERDVAIARTRLARWVGDAAERKLAARPDLDRLPLDADQLQAVLVRHPRVAGFSSGEALAQAELDVARSEKTADWSSEVMLSQRGPAYSTMITINFSIPLHLDATNRQDREIAARSALVRRASDEREEALREITAVTRAAIQAWRANQARLAHYDATLLALAAERVRAAEAAYRGGTEPLRGVLEARRLEIDVRLERLRIELESADLWARLAYLVPAETSVAGPQPVTVASAQGE